MPYSTVKPPEPEATFPLGEAIFLHLVRVVATHQNCEACTLMFWFLYTAYSTSQPSASGSASSQFLTSTCLYIAAKATFTAWILIPHPPALTMAPFLQD